MSRTSISCSKETREALAEQKDDESWDEFLQGLVGADTPEDTVDAERILNRLDDLENTLPEKTARSLETRFR